MPRIPSLISLGLAISATSAYAPEIQIDNANHIFNAIHSSMRQWGSSLNHNGMSYFLATVPAGTQLYHGTSSPDRVNGTEWLAFEPEHASVFARPRRGPPPGKGGPPGPKHHPFDDDEEWHPPQVLDEHSRDRLSLEDERPESGRWQDPHDGPKQGLRRRHFGEDEEEERPLTHTAIQRERHRELVEQTYKKKPRAKLWHKDGEKNFEEKAHGYLHTYRPKHDLRLLYIDGQSGAKSSKGTLDSQDIVLLHDTPPPSGGDHHDPPPPQDEPKKHHPGGPMNEVFRAEHLCALAEKNWNNRIDGFLRMELGFEIILCSFERHLDVARITQVKESHHEGGPGGRDNGEQFNYYRAVASRFDGIGANRVHINHNDFVTLFTSPEALYFEPETNLPRIRNQSDLIKPIQASIAEMIFRNHSSPSTSTNWQSLTDMILSRYSDTISLLLLQPTLLSLRNQINLTLRPFIDSSARNPAAEINRCATQYFPTLPSKNTLAGTAILNVTTTLCAALTKASKQVLFEDALNTIGELKEWLGWTTWKRCRGCGVEEVCFVPIWPMGGEEEMREPRCVASLEGVGRGYWGGRAKEGTKGGWF